MIKCFCEDCGPKGRWFPTLKRKNIHLGINKSLLQNADGIKNKLVRR